MTNEKTEEEVPIFVMYKLSKSERWNYGKLPSKWWWVGGGTYLGKDCVEYPKDEQFSGPIRTRPKMREFLKKKFTQLKKDGIVQKYKIRNKYDLLV